MSHKSGNEIPYRLFVSKAPNDSTNLQLANWEIRKQHRYI